MKNTCAPSLHKAYVICLALIWFGLCIGVLLINSLVDPLWHFSGNLIANNNYGFNERQAKINQLLSNPKKYDCLIFGSSRVTLLPAESLLPHRCFNLSFSGGQVEEFIAFANYLAQRNIRPSMIIVGVDGFNFLARGRDPLSIPGYITKQAERPGVLQDYLSIDSLRMTWRTLINDSPLQRYYNAQFIAQFKPDAPRFQPNKTLEGEGLRRAKAHQSGKSNYATHNAAYYQKLTQVFPDAKMVAYVPPISAWHVAQMKTDGTLSDYVDALNAAAAHFPVFIDFSIPSPVTWRTDNTYDGSHYTPDVNRSIAYALLANKPQTWGVDPKSINAEAYQNRYQEALGNFFRAVPPLPD